MKKTRSRNHTRKNKTVRSINGTFGANHIVTSKSSNSWRKKKSYRRGGMWPFTSNNNDNKPDLKLDGVVPSTSPETTEPVQKKMNYPIVSLSYKNDKITCDICKKNSFYKIDMSIQRSKAASIITGFVVGDGLSDIIEHPVKCYLCTTCLNCRFVYADTTWNGVKSLIKES